MHYSHQICLKETFEEGKFNSEIVIVSVRDYQCMSYAVLISNILHLFCPIEIDEKHFSFTFTLVSFGRCVLKLFLFFSPLQETVERPQEVFVILALVVARLKIFTSLQHI